MADDRSRAIAAGTGLGVGIGAGWGYLLPTIAADDPILGMTFGAGAGLVIAMLAGAATYRVAVEDA